MTTMYVLTWEDDDYDRPREVVGIYTSIQAAHDAYPELTWESETSSLQGIPRTLLLRDGSESVSYTERHYWELTPFTVDARGDAQ